MKHDLTMQFAALGDETRFSIVSRLLEEGETSAGAIAAQTEISAPAVSRHLRVLHKAGLITRRVNAQQRLYSANPQAIAAISDWAMSHRAFWENSLDRLGAALAAGEPNG